MSATPVTPPSGSARSGSGRRRRPGRGRTWAWLALGALLIAAAAWLTGPSSTSSILSSPDPAGALAFRRLLEDTGVSVQESASLPPAGTFFLFQDLRSEPQAGALLHWVEGGGRLVLTDPASVTAGLAGVRSRARLGGLVGNPVLSPQCPALEAAVAPRVVVHPLDPGLAGVGPGSVACYPGRDGAFEIIVPRGQGSVVVLGSESPLTNQLLGSADNAAFARALVGSGPVVFGPPLPPGTPEGRRGVWASLPLPARVVLLEIAAAAVTFALVRGRRLGRPVEEVPISPLPAGELVRATARLYRQAQAVSFSAGLLRTESAARLSRDLGVSPAQPAEVEALTGTITGLDPARVRRALAGPEPATDAELIALARELEEICREVERTTR